MIIGIGTDIVDLRRIEKIYDIHGERFLNKIYTVKEIEFIKSNKSKTIKRLANRFAAKEALYKSLNYHNKKKGLFWKDVETLNLNQNIPTLRIKKNIESVFMNKVPNKYSYKLHLTLSDELKYAIAFVIIEAIPI